jgi:hypothetical protein
VSESAIDDFELERREPNAITTDAIRRAFEAVGVVFLRQDDVQLRSDVSAGAATTGGARAADLAGRPGVLNAYTARRAAQPTTNCIYGSGIISCN